MEKRLLTAQELAQYIGSTKGTVYTWSCTRKIPPACIVHLGRALRFDIIQVNKWLAAQSGRA
ncbi:MAG: helix-turn-helix domain-containing protein [Elusimicrobia bacterium]|nr:helix-turn-helix domain-containing protein [Elusimicrobiota bacterium]